MEAGEGSSEEGAWPGKLERVLGLCHQELRGLDSILCEMGAQRGLGAGMAVSHPSLTADLWESSP